MKKIAFTLYLIILTSYSYAQQFLWSTEATEDIRHIPLENVTKEVLKFYDHYEFYYDGAGYSKAGFLKSFDEYGDDSEAWESFKKRINDIDELTVFTLRSNLGRGSVILVMAISKNDVNLITFSNFLERDGILTVERRKFANWYNSLLNLSTDYAYNEDEVGIVNSDLPTLDDIISDITDEPSEMEEEPSGLGDGGYGEGEFDESGDGIFGRKVIHRDPGMIRLVSGKSGKIVFRICINRRGNISYVEIDEMQTTIKNTSTLRNALESMRKYRFEVDYNAPKEQCGTFEVTIDNYRGIRG